MAAPDNDSILFNYRTVEGAKVELKVSKEEREIHELKWRTKIIANHKGMPVPNNLIVEVIVSNDGSKVLRLVYLEDRPLLTDRERFILKFIEMHPDLNNPIHMSNSYFTKADVDELLENLFRKGFVDFDNDRPENDVMTRRPGLTEKATQYLQSF